MMTCLIRIILADGRRLRHQGPYLDPVEATLAARLTYPGARRISTRCLP